MGDSDKFIECMGGGVVAEGGSGAVCHTAPRAGSALIWRGVSPWDKPASNPAMITARSPGTKQPATPHNQPPNSHTATQELLTPNDTTHQH